jgi:hypothetical protein
MRFPTTAVLGELWQKALISLAHPTRFERVTFAFGEQQHSLHRIASLFFRRISYW